MKYLTFSNNDKMPAFGLGTWKSDPGEVKKAVEIAIKTGYRHIDCAAIYGNEKEVGEGIAQCIKEGVVKRDELWVTSKLWNDSHKKEHVKPALEKTLKDLQLEYLDLYLIHWPIAFKHGTSFPENGDGFLSLDEVPITETWEGMESVKQEGLTKHIGVSNFSEDKLKELINTGTPPEMNQVELHPHLQQKTLIDFCHNNNIQVTAYSPLGSMDRPENMKKDNEPVPLKHEVIQSIADKHGCSPAQVLIAWALARNTAVIPKSTNEGRIKENFKAQDISLTDEDMEAIKKLDRGERIIDGSLFVTDDGKYTLESIWG